MWWVFAWALRRLCAKHPELIKTVDGRNPHQLLPVDMINIKHIPLFTTGFIHPRWFEIAGFLNHQPVSYLELVAAGFSAPKNKQLFNRLIGVGEVSVLVYVDFLCVGPHGPGPEQWFIDSLKLYIYKTCSHLKMDGWKTFSFPFGVFGCFWPIFRGEMAVSFKEGKSTNFINSRFRKQGP